MAAVIAASYSSGRSWLGATAAEGVETIIEVNEG
jgi:hypothetical protein